MRGSWTRSRGLPAMGRWVGLSSPRPSETAGYEHDVSLESTSSRSSRPTAGDEGARDARRAVHPLVRASLRGMRPGEAAGGPDPGRVDRSRVLDGALRPRAQGAVHELRDPDDRRRDPPPLSGPRVGPSCATADEGVEPGLTRTMQSQTAELGRAPDPRAAEATDAAEDEVIEALDIGGILDPLSLPAPRSRRPTDETMQASSASTTAASPRSRTPCSRGGPRRARRARAADRRVAILRRSHAVRDRGADRHLADARLPPAPASLHTMRGRLEDAMEEEVA